MSDDATKRVLHAAVFSSESRQAVMTSLGAVLRTEGIPMALYTDRAGWAFHTPKAQGPVDKSQLTQVGRALARLGIEHIPSYSPQARGRSERLNRTFQDRLVNELRVAGIATIAAANVYLAEHFVPQHNATFARPPRDPASAFVALGSADIDAILCHEETRADGRCRASGRPGTARGPHTSLGPPAKSAGAPQAPTGVTLAKAVRSLVNNTPQDAAPGPRQSRAQPSGAGAFGQSRVRPALPDAPLVSADGPLLAVVTDPGGLRFLDRDHHRRHDRHARLPVDLELGLDRIYFLLAARFQLQRPGPERVVAQQQAGAHLLQAFAAHHRHDLRKRRHRWYLHRLKQQMRVVFRQAVEDVAGVRLPRRILQPEIFAEPVLRPDRVVARQGDARLAADPLKSADGPNGAGCRDAVLHLALVRPSFTRVGRPCEGYCTRQSVWCRGWGSNPHDLAVTGF